MSVSISTNLGKYFIMVIMGLPSLFTMLPNPQIVSACPFSPYYGLTDLTILGLGH